VTAFVLPVIPYISAPASLYPYPSSVAAADVHRDVSMHVPVRREETMGGSKALHTMALQRKVGLEGVSHHTTTAPRTIRNEGLDGTTHCC